MAEYVIANKADLVNIASSIRTKSNTNSELSFPYGFVNAIGGISGGGSSNTFATTTINGSELDYSMSLTIPELIGAKYFIIKGNFLDGYQCSKLTTYDDGDVIHTVIYINGTMFIYHADLGGTSGECDIACSRELTDGWSFDTTTGTISFDGYCFNRYTADTTTGDVTYTVYRLG